MCVLEDGIFDEGVARGTYVYANDRRFAYYADRAYDQTMDLRATFAAAATRASYAAAGGRVTRFTNGAIVAVGRLSISCSATACAYSRYSRSGVLRAANDAVYRFTCDDDVHVVNRYDEGAGSLFGRDDREGGAFPQRI